uniref:Uncharacterized protein n=1 Tax=Mycena chlorophos TaxID=658473 RepID=A0ABQ0LM43_MYCCL|nr:predicted protein [Mycena chlorophos]
MAAYFPLAALTLFLSASLSSPAGALFRAVQQRAMPAAEQPHVAAGDDVPSAAEDAPAEKPPTTLRMLLGVAVTYVLASIRGTRRTTDSVTSLPVEADETTRVSVVECDQSVHDESHDENDYPESDSDSDSIHVRPDTPSRLESTLLPAPTADLAVAPVLAPTRPALRAFPTHHIPPSSARAPGQRRHDPPPYMVDMRIAWEEIWPPQLEQNAPKFGFNSFYSQFTIIVPAPAPFLVPSEKFQEDPAPACTPVPDLDAFALVEQLDDEDLISAFRELALSERATQAKKNSKKLSPEQIESFLASLPPAGISPFCPPLLPQPPPPPPATTVATWRLDWC